MQRISALGRGVVPLHAEIIGALRKGRGKTEIGVRTAVLVGSELVLASVQQEAARVEQARRIGRQNARYIQNEYEVVAVLGMDGASGYRRATRL